MKKILVVMFCLVLAVAMLTACSAPAKDATPAEDAVPAEDAAPAGDATPAEDAAPVEGEVYTIAALMKDTSDQFVKNIADAIQARADELPEVELLIQDAGGDISKQLSQCEAMVTQGVDAIILNAQDSEGLGAAVDLCNEAGIPIIECNTLTTNDNYDSYVGSNDVDAGEIQGTYINELLGGEGNICIMYGPIGQSPQIFRKEGYENTILKSEGINVLADQTANWKRDEALALAESWILAYPDLEAILCQNDDMAMGALQAVEAAGKLDQISVSGIDAIPDALQAVKDGKLSCTVFQDSKGQGAMSVDVALAWAKGETQDKEVMIPFQLVTADKVDEFMGLNEQ